MSTLTLKLCVYVIVCVCVPKDLLYEYSFSVGNRPPRILYQGRDFQYYFSLPSGDRSDDNKGKHTDIDSWLLNSTQMFYQNILSQQFPFDCLSDWTSLFPQ